jgi:hypothetical protein
MMRRALLLLAAAALAGASPAADTIRLVDGTVLENVTIASEGWKDVAYKDSKGDKTVPSESVLAVEYAKLPPQLDEAEGFVVAEDLESAVDALDAFVEATLTKPPPQFKWAPAHAAWRAVQVRQRVADLAGIEKGATRIVQSFPDSRYALLAYLARAEAELASGQPAKAKETAAELAAKVAAQSLPKRWELECRMLQALADDKLKPESRRNELERVVTEAGELPSVQARARVRVAETYLVEAAANMGKAKDLRAQAQAAFELVLASGVSDRDALAGAYCGLGESLFLQGADASDKAVLQDAALNFLRVTTLYRDDGQTVAKALFFAMRSFDLMLEPSRKADMRRELLGRFPLTTWAKEAKQRY